MKKLLLGLGAVASVAAPVAAVVACSSDNGSETTVTSASLDTLFKSKGYTLGVDGLSKVMSALGTNAIGDIETKFTIGKVVSGQVLTSAQEAAAKDTVSEDYHNGNDFLIIIHGGTQKTVDSTDGTASHFATIGDSHDNFEMEWGISMDQFAGATSLIYLHNSDTRTSNGHTTQGVIKVTVNQVATIGGKIAVAGSGAEVTPITGATYTEPTA